MRRIEERNALETAHRALGNCGQVFRYAVATGRASRDPAADLRGALPPVKGAHFAAITEPKRAGELLRMLEGYQGTLTVRCALRLAPLVFVRPGELRAARWADIDFDTAEWRYTVNKTDTMIGFTGPMPPRIIEASSSESIQSSPPSQWYPATPMNKTAAITPQATTMAPTSRCAKTDNGASFW